MYTFSSVCVNSEWGDWQEEEGCQAVCLFCPHTSPLSASLMDHMKVSHRVRDHMKVSQWVTDHIKVSSQHIDHMKVSHWVTDHMKVSRQHTDHMKVSSRLMMSVTF